MSFATHIIKIKGHFDVKRWDKNKIKRYLDGKVKLLKKGYADIELFNVKDNKINLWVYIHEPFISAKTLKLWMLDWIKKNSPELKSNGIHMDELNVEEIKGYLDGIRIMIG